MPKNTYTPLTRNVTAVFRTATAEEIDEGILWYADALNVSSALAVRHNVTVDTAIGVIAALSPLNSWGNNINLAARVLKGKGEETRGGLGKNILKANRIIKGEDPMGVFRTSHKVRNFYLSIRSMGAEGVCVDRHAFDIAVNRRLTDETRPGLSGKRYDAVAETYVRAAKILSREYDMRITPAQVQSVTWTVWRRRFWADGAWDGHAEI